VSIKLFSQKEKPSQLLSLQGFFVFGCGGRNRRLRPRS